MSYTPSKKEAIEEIIKWGKDPVYFINNYCRIPELNGAFVGGASLDPAALVQLAIALQ